MALYSSVTKQWTQTRRQGWRFWAGLGVALAVASVAVPFRDNAVNVVTAAILDDNPTDAGVVADDPVPTGALPPPGLDDRSSASAATPGTGEPAAARTSEDRRRLILLYALDGAGLRYFGGLSKH
jgi:hypothetical protein